MSVQEDILQIKAAVAIIERMEAKYEPLLRAFAVDVRARHQPGDWYCPLNAYRYLATGSGYFTLDGEITDKDHIVFTDYDNDAFLLPREWLEDPEAWHTKAAAAEAEYRAAQEAKKQATQQEKISRLRAQLAAAEAEL